jgi:hypothetical protein
MSFLPVTSIRGCKLLVFPCIGLANDVVDKIIVRVALCLALFFCYVILNNHCVACGGWDIVEDASNINTEGV